MCKSCGVIGVGGGRGGVSLVRFNRVGNGRPDPLMCAPSLLFRTPIMSFIEGF